jgi:hypothetical protein
MGGACSTHWRYEKAYKILVRILEGKRPLRRPRHRWEENTGMDLVKVG